MGSGPKTPTSTPIGPGTGIPTRTGRATDSAVDTTGGATATPARADSTGRASGNRPPGAAVFVGVLALVLAAALPLSALLLAGRWATAEVTASTVAGERSTATAVGQQADQSYEDALAVLRAAPGRLPLLRGLSGGDLADARSGLDNLRASGPFADVGLFWPSGRLLAQVPAASSAPAPAAGTVAGSVAAGPLREVGSRSLRAVTVAVSGPGGRLVGFVTADIDVRRLFSNTTGLRFASTGNSSLVATDGRVLIDDVPGRAGTYVQTPAILRFARAHRPGMVTATTVRTHRSLVLVYQPVAGQPWGVLTSQTTAEAFAGADRLNDRLRLVSAVFAGLGLLLAGLVMVMVTTRDRRIRSQTAALAAAQQTFRSAFDNAPTGVALVDLDGRFQQVNRSMSELTGYTEAQLRTRTIAEITHPDDRTRDEAVLAGRRAGHDAPLSLEKRYLRADGSMIWVSSRSTLAVDADGRPDHVISHVTDITERHAVATALAERNVQLAQARDAALAATAAKSAFLATMSHEIRTPMNAVIGMTGLLLDTDLDPGQRQFTETVRSSGEALIAILNDILDFSKIESGDLELEVAPFGVRDCVESAVELVALAAQQKGLVLVAELAEPCPEVVVGDVTRFRQVIVNLVGNAVKFTDRGEVHVVVAAQRLGPGSAEVVRFTVSVRDTGVGVPTDRMDRLFQPFSQADSSTTRTHGGTGLGLVISRRLARAMGGDVQVASAVGVGSTFTFTADVAAADDRRADTGGPGAQPGPLAATEVLLVDANATSRGVLGRLLRSWGVVPTAVATRADALGLLSTGHRFDAAILNVAPPEASGPKLAGALRAVPAGRQLPLVLLTDLDDHVSPAQRTMFAATLTRPARAVALHDGLLQAIDPAHAVMALVETAGGRRSSDGPDIARPLRVLLAEDNQVNQKVAQLMLTRLGHRVDTVGDGMEAVDAVRRASYDVLLMDVQMPHLDGLRATEQIRAALAADCQPWIVGMTANVLVEDRAACTAAGMDAFLPKPVRLADLAAVLDQVGRRVGGHTRPPGR